MLGQLHNNDLFGLDHIIDRKLHLQTGLLGHVHRRQEVYPRIFQGVRHYFEGVNDFCFVDDVAVFCQSEEGDGADVEDLVGWVDEGVKYLKGDSGFCWDARWDQSSKQDLNCLFISCSSKTLIRLRNILRE